MSSQDAQETTITLESLIKTVSGICIATGPAVLAYFLASFTVDRSGYYYDVRKSPFTSIVE